MKKILFAATTLLLSVPVLMSCTPSGPYVEPGATTITMYAQDFQDWENAHIAEMVDDFNAIKDDGIQLEVKSFQDEAYTDALKAARENGSAPDIFMCSYGNLYSTAIKPGYAAPLNDLLDQAYYDDIVDSVKSMITFDGNYYSYPQLTEPATVFFYRKDILANAGVTEIPTTWDELLVACSLIKPVLGRGQYTLGMPIGTALGWATYGMQKNTTGGLALNDQWTECLVDSQGYRDLDRLFYELYANGYCPAGNVSPTGYTDIITALCEDKLAMTFAGSWSVADIINSYPDYKDKIGIAPIPTQDGDPTKTTASNGGWTYAISSTSDQKVKAARVLEWFFCEDPARTASYFEDAAYSKTAVNKSVIAYIENTVPADLKDWVSVINDISSKGIPEATYPWDIAIATATMFETMAIKADLTKGDAYRDTQIENAINTAVSAINTIITDSGFVTNPVYD